MPDNQHDPVPEARVYPCPSCGVHLQPAWSNSDERFAAGELAAEKRIIEYLRREGAGRHCIFDVNLVAKAIENGFHRKQEADSFPTDADKESDRVAAMEKVVTAAEVVRAGIRYGYAPEIGQFAIIEALDEYHATLSRSAEEE